MLPSHCNGSFQHYKINIKFFILIICPTALWLAYLTWLHKLASIQSLAWKNICIPEALACATHLIAGANVSIAKLNDAPFDTYDSLANASCSWVKCAALIIWLRLPQTSTYNVQSMFSIPLHYMHLLCWCSHTTHITTLSQINEGHKTLQDNNAQYCQPLYYSGILFWQ